MCETREVAGVDVQLTKRVLQLDLGNQMGVGQLNGRGVGR